MRRLTGGNPLFVREAGIALAERRAGRAGSLVTSGIGHAVGARVRALPEPAPGLLSAAAVLGREFDVCILAGVLEIDELQCLTLLVAAARAGLVEPTSTRGRQRFVHALVRDALVDELPPADRLRLHAAAAASLERLHGAASGPHVFEIAAHRAEAAPLCGRREAAVWLERAADLAFAQLGYEDAARMYRDGLAVAGNDLDAAQRCRLQLGAARGRAPRPRASPGRGRQ